MPLPSKKDYLLGLIGHPVSHSLSPRLHGAAFAYHGLNGQYDLIDVESEALAFQIADLRKRGYYGLNVTIPHKQAVMPLLQELSAEAVQVGAVNTIAFTNDLSIGYNTDVLGFARSLTEAIEKEQIDSQWSGASIVIGCGGAARAVVAGLCDLGYFDISIYGRDFEKAKDFVNSLCTSFGPRGQLFRDASLLRAVDELSAETLADKFLLVNATPLGQTGESLPIWLSEAVGKLDKRALIYDLVYSKDETPTALEKSAREHKLASIDGLDMLVYQAARAFEIWTGLTVPAEIMKDGLRLGPRI